MILKIFESEPWNTQRVVLPSMMMPLVHTNPKQDYDNIVSS